MTTHTFATVNDPSIYVELATVNIAAATIAAGSDVAVAPRAPVGTVVKVREASTLADLPDTATLPNGYINYTVDSDSSQMSALLSVDGGATWVGPFWSKESLAGQALASATAEEALGEARDAHLPAGTDGYVLYSDPAAPSHGKWGPPPAGSTVGAASFPLTTVVSDSTRETIGDFTVTDDGTPTSGWPDRLKLFFGASRTRMVQWWNEYGEWRGMPAKPSTVGWRLFALNSTTETRSPDVPVWQISDDRTRRTDLASINHRGDMHLAGALNGIQFGGMLTDGQLPPAGTPAGTVFLVRSATP